MRSLFATPKNFNGVVKDKMQCTLCNETFEQIEIDFGEVLKMDDEYWHAECYSEYFEVSLQKV